jgi:hypothetical protein
MGRVMKVSIGLAVLLMGTGSAVAKECRMPDLPADARVAIPPECKDAVRVKDSGSTQGGLKADRGFVDLGGGTKVRIGGRVRAEYGFRR